MIGGGLAGIAAACALAERGIRVSLLEKRPHLGGRAYSFVDKAVGEEIDNGQHIFMRCCTEYIAFLRKLGVYHRTDVQQRLQVHVFGRGAKSSILTSASLPAPFHLAPSLMAYRHLSLPEKLAVAGVVLKMRSIAKADRLRLDGETFYSWLRRKGQSDHAIDTFWDLITVPTLNDCARDVSASQAIMVFQEGFLSGRHGADIGLSNVGLSALLYEEARVYVESRGGMVTLSENVAALEGSLYRVERARTQSGTDIAGDAFVLALPPAEMLDLLPPSMQADPFFTRAKGLTMSPIVNLHLWMDRPVTNLRFAVYLNSTIQWLFTKPSQGLRGQHLVVSISGAHEYIDMPKEALLALVERDLRERVPGAANAKVLKSTTVRERYATFSPRPGSATFRLPWRTPVPNLFLAGAWTDTGWPATMESAVRSGIFCAQAVAGA